MDLPYRRRNVGSSPAPQGEKMDREYDLYERTLDGLLWRGFARGLENARRRLRRLSLETQHDCFGLYLPTREVIQVKTRAAKR